MCQAGPRRLLAAQAQGVVPDEGQRVPEQMPYLQTSVDTEHRPGRFTGLAAWLLGITDAGTMNAHPMRGALFENLCIAEYGKHLRHTGAAGTMYLPD